MFEPVQTCLNRFKHEIFHDAIYVTSRDDVYSEEPMRAEVVMKKQWKTLIDGAAVAPYPILHALKTPFLSRFYITHLLDISMEEQRKIEEVSYYFLIIIFEFH